MISAYTLTLAGTPSAFRIWPDVSGTNAPLLGCRLVLGVARKSRVDSVRPLAHTWG